MLTSVISYSDTHLHADENCYLISCPKSTTG